MKRNLLYYLCWAAGFALVFIVPWYVGDPPQAAGQSFEYGFNNRFAFFSLAITLIALTAIRVWLLLPSQQNNYLECINGSQRTFPKIQEAKGEYLVLAAFAIVAICAHVVWNSLLVLPYWGGELAYFLGRLDLLQLGFRPHIDFQFNYGPLLLYAPHWVCKFSGGVLAIEDAYVLFLALSFAVGFLAVFVFLRSLNLPSKWRAGVLALALSMWMLLTMGLNYSPLRFTTVPALLALFHLLLSREARLLTSTALGFLGAATCTSLSLLLSPEMGVASVVAFLGYSGVLFIRGKIVTPLAILLGAGISLAVIGFSFAGYFWSIGAFSSGGYNFPIFPNAPNIILLVCAFLILPGLVFSSLNWIKDCRAPYAAALAGSGAMLLPAAFGRCDPGHIAVNGYALFMLCFAVAANFSKLAMQLWAAVFAVVFVVLLQFSYFSHYEALLKQPFQIRALLAANPEAQSQWRAVWASITSQPNIRSLPWKKVVPPPSALLQLKPNETVGMPFEMDISLERSIKALPIFKPVYFQPPISTALSPRDIDRTFEDCLNLSLILIPEHLVATANASVDLAQYAEGTSKFVSGLMLFPVVVPMVNEPYFPDRDLVSRLLQHCDVERTSIDGVLALRPRKSAQ